ncbi:ankyrin repeat-containing domain protein [Mycena latifolia]|nr:ankyrin repeat-containing domain protein [Mycena latifolia]
MSTNYFAELPPELILLISKSLSPRSLGALAITCRRLHDILQPELEAHITPAFRRYLLVEAAAGDPDIVAKLLSSPHPIELDGGYNGRTPLHVAVNTGNREIAALLLAAGADVTVRLGGKGLQALHLAVCNMDLEMMKLLLDYGAPVDEPFGVYREQCASPLHHACAIGHLDMVKLLLDRGASLEYRSTLGTALWFAERSGQKDVVKLLRNPLRWLKARWKGLSLWKLKSSE